MTTPNETTGTDIGLLAVLGTILAFIGKKWLAKLNPWPLLQRAMVSLSEPLMKAHIGPLIEKIDCHGEKIDRICKVIDNLPGADDAHAAVLAESVRDQSHWGRTAHTGTGG